MKATVTINIEVEDLAHLERIIHAGLGTTATLETVQTSGSYTESATSEEGEAAPKRKTKRKAKRKTRAKKEPAKADIEEADEQPAKTDAEETDAEEVDDQPTEGDLKKAVKSAIEKKGIDKVRAVFSDFKGKDGKPAVKLSDVKESDYAAVIEALA